MTGARGAGLTGAERGRRPVDRTARVNSRSGQLKEFRSCRVVDFRLPGQAPSLERDEFGHVAGTVSDGAAGDVLYGGSGAKHAPPLRLKWYPFACRLRSPFACRPTGIISSDQHFPDSCRTTNESGCRVKLPPNALSSHHRWGRWTGADRWSSTAQG